MNVPQYIVQHEGTKKQQQREEDKIIDDGRNSTTPLL